MVAFYMTGDALSWYKWLHQNNQLYDWDSFTRALELRFGPSTYENHMAALFKLNQTGSLADYQLNFERLSNKVFGLPPEALLNNFISGLIPEIRVELALLRPLNVSQAMGLAKLVEAKLKDSKPNPNPKPFSKVHSPSLNPTTTPSQSLSSSTTTLPVKKVTPSQLQERRTLGLCYYCDEKYHSGHRCQPKQFHLLLVDEEDCSFPTFSPTSPSIPLPSSPNSPQALNGSKSPPTLRFHGSISGHSVTVLIDTGSSHNIMQPRLALHLGLPTSPTPTFPVMVGNGDFIYCNGFCPNVPHTLQTHTFTLPFYLLPNSSLVRVCPYHYPHTQKETISQIVADLLSDGLIAPSHSPFSSPVILVQKKR
uniref:Retrotransposon-derived protein PEG10 n=1 Tax=Cajanus cajan TaxID=3821 RepID=A0A151R4Q1_CAJCA|nr:Retrotransposon-derived protein PEG10 [Cajanus cajan]